jgi:hypothetical protein
VGPRVVILDLPPVLLQLSLYRVLALPLVPLRKGLLSGYRLRVLCLAGCPVPAPGLRTPPGVDAPPGELAHREGQPHHDHDGSDPDPHDSDD